MSEATEAVGEYSEQKTKQFLQDAQQGLDQLKKEVGRLKEDVAKLQETGQAEFQESIDELDGKLAAADRRLDQLRDAGGEAWEQAQDDLEKAMDDLQTAYEDAAAAFDEASSGGGETETAPAQGAGHQTSSAAPGPDGR